VDFEWDEDKNQKNIRIHGFDFGDAWKVFDGPLFMALDTRSHYGEDRWIVIGLLGDRIVVVIFTTRGSGTVRLISLRKALKHEPKQFEEAIKDELGAH
jgi:uncharacterized protein